MLFIRVTSHRFAVGERSSHDTPSKGHQTSPMTATSPQIPGSSRARSICMDLNLTFLMRGRSSALS